jgi:hypothetical protein
LKIVVFTKKISNEFGFSTKIQWKGKQSKKKVQLVYFYIFFIFLLHSFFLKKHRKLHSVKFLHRFFFGVKKHFTLNQFFFKTPPSVFLKYRFLFYTVYCAGVIFGNFGCTPECKCKFKKIHCTAMPVLICNSFLGKLQQNSKNIKGVVKEFGLKQCTLSTLYKDRELLKRQANHNPISLKVKKVRIC